MDKLAAVLGNCRSVAVFLGLHGMGQWQQRERDLALNRQTPFSIICPHSDRSD